MLLRGNKNNQGFTLIELLVVIAIIGLLASVVLVALNSARSKARDAKRLADMSQLTKALELYYNQYGQYPGYTNDYGEAEALCGGWDTSKIDNDSDGKPFIEPLVDARIVSRTPNDPSAQGTTSCFGKDGGYEYRYYRYPANSYGSNCAKNFYVLGITNMESVSGGASHPDSPGWSCTGNPNPRDWAGEYEWVTGGFE